MELYHFTCIDHLMDILETGVIKCSNSQLKQPTAEETRVLTKFYKGSKEPPTETEQKLLKQAIVGKNPVVWFTDKKDPERMGLDANKPVDLIYDKKQICIVVEQTPDFKHWQEWALKKHINLDWYRRITNGYDYKSWYILERPLKLSEIKEWLATDEAMKYIQDNIEE